MNPFLAKVLSFAQEVRTKDKDISLDLKTPLPINTDRELYKHQVLAIEEDFINRLLRAHFHNHWAVYSATVEFEPNNQVMLTLITTWGNVVNLNFTIEDLWFDDYTI